MDTARPRALIADDEPLLAADLATRLARLWPELDIVAVVHHGPAAVETLQSLQPDIAFLDIRMPGLSGLEVAEQTQIRHLVFVTAYDQYAAQAFDTAAIDYLLKPASDERLGRCIERLKARIEAPMQPVAALLEQIRNSLRNAPEKLRWIRASHGQDVHLVDVDEVVYFRADDKYTVVQTAQREYLIRIPLKDLLLQLDPSHFWQIHRNTIVNTRSITTVRRELTGRAILYLKHREETLTVSRAFSHLFKQM